MRLKLLGILCMGLCMIAYEQAAAKDVVTNVPVTNVPKDTAKAAATDVAKNTAKAAANDAAKAAPKNKRRPPSLSQLISAGDFQTAAAVLEASNPTPADRLFFVGRVLKAQGRYAEAIDTFREVLRIDPNYLNARRELAHTLMLNEEYEAAEYHFEELMRIDNNENMRDGYRQFLARISELKPAGLSGFISILPSSNVNRGSSQTIFDTNLGEFVINPESRAKSGIGVRAGVSGFSRYLMSPSSRLSFQWSAVGTVYGKKIYNNLVGNVSVGYEQVTENGYWSLSPYYRRAWYKDDSDNDAVGLGFFIRHRVNPKTQVAFSLDHEYRTYETLNYLNGSFSVGSVSLTRQLSPSLSVDAVLGYERSHPKDSRHLQYNAYRALTEVTRSWTGGLSTSIGVEYGERHYRDDYPLTSSPRRDKFYKFGFTAYHSKINIRGFTPYLDCSHTINHSNVAFFKYHASECAVTMSRRF